jgi:hypothetical protein
MITGKDFRRFTLLRNWIHQGIVTTRMPWKVGSTDLTFVTIFIELFNLYCFLYNSFLCYFFLICVTIICTTIYISLNWKHKGLFSSPPFSLYQPLGLITSRFIKKIQLLSMVLILHLFLFYPFVFVVWCIFYHNHIFKNTWLINTHYYFKWIIIKTLFWNLG